jgi:NADPH:quinone reductase-like Zn-dependent oxidoreductase
MSTQSTRGYVHLCGDKKASQYLSVQSTMKAIQLHDYGFDQLRYEEVPTPVTGPGHVLVRIAAASISPVDAGKAAGALRHLPTQFPWIPGGDFAGTVAAVGAGVSELVVGTEVYGTGPAAGNSPAYGGAYAQYIVVPANTVAEKPKKLSFIEAAAVPISALTAWQALFRIGQLQAGQSVLIHGGAGGVGAYAIQLAHLHGAKVITTASSQDLEFVRALGADEVLDYQAATPFEALVREVDVVLDTVGGEVQQRSYGVLKAGGHLIALNHPPAPEEAAKYGVNATMFDLQPSAENLTYFATLLDAGTLKVDVARTYPLEQAAQALVASTQHGPAATAPKIHGKIVLVVAQEQ